MSTRARRVSEARRLAYPQNTVFAIGKSIFNRSSKLDIGELALKYGGGGYENAGTCQIENDKAEAVRPELITAIR